MIENLPEKYKILKLKKEIVDDKQHNNKIQPCKFFRGELMDYLGKNKSLIEMYFKDGVRVERSDLPVSELDLNTVIHTILHKEDILNKLLSVMYIYPKANSRLNGISKDLVLEMLSKNDYS